MFLVCGQLTYRDDVDFLKRPMLLLAPATMHIISHLHWAIIPSLRKNLLLLTLLMLLRLKITHSCFFIFVDYE